jgi:hypothetical protein
MLLGSNGMSQQSDAHMLQHLKPNNRLPCFLFSAAVCAALDQLRPEFALSVPRVSGRLLLATTSRLLLRQPHMVTAAEQPMLVASHLQLDCESVGDMWGGESFLTRRSPSALKAWVNRNW